jgi:hypothetical protein
VLFPPPEDQWHVPTPARDPKTSLWCHRQPGKHWTREEIEREELNKQARTLGEHNYLREVNKLEARVARELHKHQQAAWQAEADRRNAALEEREQQFASMNEGERPTTWGFCAPWKPCKSRPKKRRSRGRSWLQEQQPASG